MINSLSFPRLRVIPCASFDAKWNMAADEYLMKNSDVPLLRFYQWQKPTLSFGKSNAEFSSLDFSVIADLDIQGVIRKTGGKTVFHHQELTYSFIVQNFSFRILDFYKKISSILKRAFVSLGATTQMEKKEKNSTKNLNCFQEISSYEIEVDGRKLVGSAQKRDREMVLQHGSILLDIDFALWGALWREKEESLKKRIISFKELVENFSLERLTQKISEEFAQEFSAEIFLQNFSEQEKEAIGNLAPSYTWQSFENKKQNARK